LVKGALPTTTLPPLFDSWVSKTSDNCIYSAEQKKKFNSSHLQGGGWYIDGYRNFTPDSEVEERLALDNGQPPQVPNDIEEPNLPVTVEAKARRKRRNAVETVPDGSIKPVVEPASTESTVQAPTTADPSQSRLPTPSVSNIEQAAQALV
jgi:hypothetical protein